MMKAEQLFKAYKENTPLPLGAVDIQTEKAAYSIQDEVIQLKENEGDELKGYKISLTSEETQKMFKSDEPLYGGMPESSIVESLSLTQFNSPLAEMELVFLVEETLLPSDSNEEILNKCKVAPGIEVPDGRYKDWFPNMSKLEVIADSAVSGAVIYGTGRSVTFDEIDGINGVLKHDGEVIKKGDAREVMGHPVHAVKWLVDALHNEGKMLTPGMFISSGTFILPVKLVTGTYTAEYENIGALTFEVTV